MIGKKSKIETSFYQQNEDLELFLEKNENFGKCTLLGEGFEISVSFPLKDENIISFENEIAHHEEMTEWDRKRIYFSLSKKFKSQKISDFKITEQWEKERCYKIGSKYKYNFSYPYDDLIIKFSEVKDYFKDYFQASKIRKEYISDFLNFWFGKAETEILVKNDNIFISKVLDLILKNSNKLKRKYFDLKISDKFGNKMFLGIKRRKIIIPEKEENGKKYKDYGTEYTIANKYIEEKYYKHLFYIKLFENFKNFESDIRFSPRLSILWERFFLEEKTSKKEFFSSYFLNENEKLREEFVKKIDAFFEKTNIFY